MAWFKCSNGSSQGGVELKPNEGLIICGSCDGSYHPFYIADFSVAKAVTFLSGTSYPKYDLAILLNATDANRLNISWSDGSTYTGEWIAYGLYDTGRINRNISGRTFNRSGSQTESAQDISNYNYILIEVHITGNTSSNTAFLMQPKLSKV